ncbi:hypothetical protein H4219_003988 [Mycoemilia scoparia]|uniref:AMP-dependent synthetase/ligase domain-containing protein n=1 Tax=Mycoemilia scoparia TaxID=417184 RepID=A0A9W7ZYV9_9FUNG|nr:hypothetical protein H4219_003988 [Mycoemilia scoparia]
MIFKSPIPNVNIPFTDVASFFLGITDKSHQHSVKHGDWEAAEPLVINGITQQSLNFYQLKTKSLKLAQTLRQRYGVNPGDVVGMVLSEIHAVDLVVIHYAVMLVGGVYLPMCPGSPSSFSDEFYKDLVYWWSLANSDNSGKIGKLKCVFTDSNGVEDVKKAVIEIEKNNSGGSIDSSDGKISVLVIDSPSQSIQKEEEEEGYGRGNIIDQILHTTDINDNIYDSIKVFKPFTIDNSESQSRNTVAMIVCTSGTTGKPKAIKLSHHNLISAFVQVGGYATSHHTNSSTSSKNNSQEKKKNNNNNNKKKVGGNGGGSSILSTLLPNMMYGHCVLCYQPLFSGGNDRTVIMNHRSVPQELFEAINKYNVTRICAHPALLFMINDYGLSLKKQQQATTTTTNPMDTNNEFDYSSVINLPSLKYITCGGAFLSPKLRHNVQTMLGATLTQGYGSTETSSILAGGSWMEPKPGAVGVLYPNTQAKIIDIFSDSHELGPNQCGHLCMRGPQLMMGYINLQSPMVLGDDDDKEEEGGFLRTGDYAKITEDGHVTLIDRVVDLIVIPTSSSSQGKYQVIPPSEIELIIAKHPLVSDIAVINTPLDDDKSETTTIFGTNVRFGVAKAFIALQPNVVKIGGEEETKLKDELIQWYKDELQTTPSNSDASIQDRASIITADRIVFIDKIPKSAAGKVIKNELRSL